MANRLHSYQSVTAMIALLGSVVMADDWPAYDHDAKRSGVSSERLELPLGHAWIHYTTQQPGPAWPEPGRTANMFDFDGAFQPIASDERVYFGSSANDTLYALDATNGKICWTFTAGAPIRFAPQIADKRCYFASDDGVAYCLDALTGSRIWQFQAAFEDRMIVGNRRMISRWPCRTGVLVHERVVYLTAGMWPAEGTCFYALDAVTGKLKWSNDTLNAMYLSYPHDGVSFGGPTPQGYLSTDGKSLVVPTGQSAPAILDATSGQLLSWNPQRSGSTWTRLGDGFVMVAGRGWQPDQDLRLGEAPLFRGDGIAFYELATGEVTTSAKWREYDNLPGSVRYRLQRWRGQISPIGGRDRSVLTGDRLFTSGMGVVEAIDCSGDRLHRLWKVDFPRVYSLIVAGDHLFAGSDGQVSAIKASDGAIAWQRNVDGQVRGLAVADGALYVATDQGTLYAFASGRADVPIQRPLRKEEQPRIGFGLVAGNHDTILAEKLASTSRLNVIALVDAALMPAVRRKLLDHGYGQRIVVHPLPTNGRLPYADFFANEIVIEGTPMGVDPAELYRVLHPCTGQLRFPKMRAEEIAAFLDKAGIPLREFDGEAVHRGPLPGAFDWNTENIVDQRVKWPLELLWFGGPGRERTMTRHRQGLPPPVAAFGRTFVLGDGHVTAIDAYHGLELWSRRAPRYQHVSADDKRVFLGLSARIMQCNAATGRLEKIYGAAEPVVFSLDQAQRFHAKDNGRYSGEMLITKRDGELELALDVTTPEPWSAPIGARRRRMRRPGDACRSTPASMATFLGRR